MVFSKRERMIVAATVVALCVLVLDLYVLTPFLDQRAAVRADRTQLLAKLGQAETLLKRRRLLDGRWRGMLAGGMTHDAADAESQLLRAIRDWSDEAGMELTSLRPERSAGVSALPEIIVHAAGSGTMAAFTRLLRRIETARIPVKVKTLQLGGRKEGMDDLSVHLKVSTLYAPPVAPPGGGSGNGAGKEGGGQ